MKIFLVLYGVGIDWDAYNYDIDVNNMPNKTSDNEYIIRYNDSNNVWSMFAPLQTKINNFLGNIHKLKNNITWVSIQSDDKKTF